MPLHTDFRPSCLDEIYGNRSIKISLESIFAREKDRPHAYLFTGSSGCGKTTFGRIIASLLKCSSDDLMEYNTANMRGIDTVREIDQNCKYAPMTGKVKVYILDEIHKTTGEFQNALLKLLEDPPAHVYFILCTTDPDKLLKTIHTRCTSYQVKPLLNAEMEKLLNDILTTEGIEDFPKKVMTEIIQVSEGCARQALVILDQVIDITDEDTALEAVTAFTGETAAIIDVCKALLDKKDSGKWAKIRVMLKLIEVEPEAVRRSILGYLSAVLLNNNQNDRVAEMLGCFTDSWFNSGKGGMVQALYYASKM
jgi:DNA polymerase-3 subunit gamma/tau